MGGEDGIYVHELWRLGSVVIGIRRLVAGELGYSGLYEMEDFCCLDLIHVL